LDAIYNYSANLNTPFQAVAGTTYWMSIVPDLPLTLPDELQWGWHTGTGGDGISVQTNTLSPPFTRVLQTDLAFSLSSPAQAIPEPTSLLAWVVIGVAGGCRWCRRRKRAV
jgi:hypothetical protein